MQLAYLSLTNFRNYARLETALPNTALVLHGENAQGKTNFLESIYYLATMHSPYTSIDRHLLHWATENEPLPYARVAADVQTRRARERLEVTLMIERGPDGSPRFRKVVKVNGVEKRIGQAVGVATVVLFLPRDLALIEGAPADRRRFMDVTLSQIVPDYAEALDQYERTLPQRNALLRRIGEGVSQPKELAYWDEQLVEAGARLIAGRQMFLRELEIEAQRVHYDLTGRLETLTLRYQPSFVPTAEGDGQRSFEVLGFDLHREVSAAEVAPQFAEQLELERGESIRRGVTLSGPHRDELRILINERDAGLYGSRGQARTAVLALKLAERAWMGHRTGETPILLLDDVAAELDAKRREYLLERVQDAGQTLITTAELSIFPAEFLGHVPVWTVEAGRIRKPS
ncbi:MAG: DNA replication/repair protein RecF [Chloroflexi bacterium]|nr:MAG: DNA replication and repair protein RecF [Chloroflexi bacterium OLB13]MBC6955788.1 DNA replication/repair protein RecF [Chloroflexota bacterium]MBV6437280.1 DNA replication and repair protein RecF [Anaerolineae bacterium]MDL1915363.1 DNA replication/repair protein RecF [Anaerolineae bacterium CFX4]OQY83466.1 MAG: DNA replication/repair protein RecF [Anaerolineae bacterium UTCFX5]